MALTYPPGQEADTLENVIVWLVGKINSAIPHEFCASWRTAPQLLDFAFLVPQDDVSLDWHTTAASMGPAWNTLSD